MNHLIHKYLLLLLLLTGTVLLTSGCKPNSSKNNFAVLQQAVLEKNSKQFCNNISSQSKQTLGPGCENIPWDNLQNLFQNAKYLDQKNKIIFIQKETQVLSYPLKEEDGEWKADIIGKSGWKK